MNNKSRHEHYSTVAMLEVCQELIDHGFNPEITHRKGMDTQLSMSGDYLKSNIAGILVDLHDLVFEQIRPNLEFEPISLKGVKASNGGIKGDSITEYISGIFYDDKSGHHFSIYIDTTKMTPFGQIALNQAIEKRGDYQQLIVCDDIDNPSNEEGWTLSYSIEL